MLSPAFGRGADEPFVVGLTHEVEGHRRTVALEDHTVLRRVHLVGLPSVVEPRRDVQVELHPAPDTAEQPHDPVVLRRLGAARHRHEVDHLTHAGFGEEAGDENGGVRQVQLLGLECVLRRPHAEVAALLRGPGARRTRWVSRTAECRTSRSSRPCSPARRSAGRRSGRGPRSRGSPWQFACVGAVPGGSRRRRFGHPLLVRHAPVFIRCGARSGRRDGRALGALVTGEHQCGDQADDAEEGQRGHGRAVRPVHQLGDEDRARDRRTQ